MYARTERVLTWIALLISIAVAVIAILQIDKRSKETPSVALPTVTPSATFEAPTPLPPTEAPASTAAPEPAATEPPAPTPAPAEEPTVAAPTAPPPGASPMPHTGGGALPAGLVVVVLAGVGAVVARHTEGPDERS